MSNRELTQALLKTMSRDELEELALGWAEQLANQKADAARWVERVKLLEARAEEAARVLMGRKT